MEKIIDILEKNWHKPLSLFVALFIEFMILLSVFAGLSSEKVAIWQYIVIVIALFVTVFIWLQLVKVPKTKKNKIGFVIALNSENDEQRRVVQDDFIKEIELVLEDAKRVVNFDIIVLPKWHAEKIHNSDTAVKYLKSCRAHLLMNGDTRKRRVKGKYQYVFRLHQTVLHRIIPMDVSDKLSADFGAIFPSKLSISEDNQIEGMEIASNWMSEAAKYFIAMAACVSGDVVLAEQLLINIKNSKLLKSIKTQKGVGRIRTRSVERLVEIYYMTSKMILDRWGVSHNNELMDELDVVLTKMASINQSNNYVWKLRKAIWYFVTTGNTVEARKLVLSCAGSSDATWRYSVAFLYAFDGDLKKAIQAYNKGFARPAIKGIAVEVEAFISWAVTVYTDKYQLYFCLGYINYKLKEDYVAARRDFRNFISNLNAVTEYGEQVRLANIYLQEIDRAAPQN